MLERKRRRFTAEYKAEAVRLHEESGRSLQAIAEELGVHTNQLRGWRNEVLVAGSARRWPGRRRKPPSLPAFGGRTAGSSRRMIPVSFWNDRLDPGVQAE
jgi:transposase